MRLWLRAEEESLNLRGRESRRLPDGEKFGSPGFYFTVHRPDGTVSARYLRAMRETIHVYESDGGVRADHVLKLWGLTFLRLHYRLQRHRPAGARASS